MSDFLRVLAAQVEQYGHFRIRDRTQVQRSVEVTLLMQFTDEPQAREFARMHRRKVFTFGDSWTVYVSGQKMLLILGLARDFMCPAHRRLATLALQIRGLSEKRKLMARLQFAGKRMAKYRESCKRKNEKIARLRSQVCEDALEEYAVMEKRCPVWAAMGPPMQLRLREWWKTERPVENEEYWRKRGLQALR